MMIQFVTNYSRM